MTPSACSPASRTALFTWALGTSGAMRRSRAGARRGRRGAGGRRSASMRAPIRSSGSMTRRIGRPDSEASPTRVAVETDGRPGRPPSAASSSRIAGVERPGRRTEPAQASSHYSNGAGGRLPVVDLDAERRRQASVDRQSAPGAKLCSADWPSASAASRAYRCEMDLSPGTRRRPCRRRAGADGGGGSQRHIRADLRDRMDSR